MTEEQKSTAIQSVNWETQFALYEPELKSLLPVSLGINIERFITSAWNVLQKVEHITECVPFEVFDALKTCAMCGLDPNTPFKECSVVVFKDKFGKYHPVVYIEKQGRLKMAQRAKIKIDRRPIWKTDQFAYHYDLETQWVIVDQYSTTESTVRTHQNLRGIWITHTYVSTTPNVRRHFFFSVNDLDARVPPNSLARKINPMWRLDDPNVWKMYSKTAIHESMRDFVPVTDGERALYIADQYEVRRDEIVQPESVETIRATAQIQAPPRNTLADSLGVSEPPEQEFGETTEPVTILEVYPEPEPPVMEMEHSFYKGDKVWINDKKSLIHLNDGEERLEGIVTGTATANKSGGMMYPVDLTNGTIEFNGKQYTSWKFFPSAINLQEY